MAPRLGRSHKSGPARAESQESPGAAPAAPVAATPDNTPPTPAQLRRALQVLRRHIEQSCENVGERFADEARRIHKGEAKTRGIYGEATQSETKALLDEGIEVASLPWVPTSDA